MKTLASLLLLTFLFLAAMYRPAQAGMGPCIGCTLVVTILEQINIAHPEMKLKDAAALWCEALGGSQAWLVTACTSALGTIAPVIELDWKLGATPDETCRKLTLCSGDDAKCALWPRTASNFMSEATQTQLFSPLEAEAFGEWFEESSAIFDYVFGAITASTQEGGIKPFMDFPALSRHAPQPQSAKDDYWYLRAMIDNDRDYFSTFEQLRGSNWSGRDCDDNNADVYPTRFTTTSKTASPDIDHNCNGIYGKHVSGVSNEQFYCGSSKYTQIVALGDSATAHFSLPPAWLSGKYINQFTYQQLIPIAMNEVDFPHCGMVTGHDIEGCPSWSPSFGLYQSLYKTARSRNPCIHRAYRNLGINGASHKNYAPKLKYMFNPNPATDVPSLVVFNLIGNDVCSKRTDTASMTSEAEYKEGLMESLEHLDSVLTPGSHVFISGLVDGRVLYDTMGSRTHPAGMPYKAFYNYLNCLQTSPCAGWMNEDAAIRDATTAHAQKLGAVARDVAQNIKFKNFKLFYFDLEASFNKIVAEFKAKQYDLGRLIEATDGFHPSSIALSQLASKFIDNAQNIGVFNDIFPFNSQAGAIYQQFGLDLNGY